MSTLQKGLLFIEQTVEGASMKSPIPGATLYFMQDGVTKASTTTSKTGEFSITLPVGEYSIATEKIGGFNGKIPLAAGQTIKLTKNSPQNAVEEFITTAVGADVDGELVKQFEAYLAQIETKTDEGKKAIQLTLDNGKKDVQGLVNQAQNSATSASKSAQEAKNAASSIPDIIPVNRGGTGATIAAKARENLGALGFGDYGLGIQEREDILPSGLLYETNSSINPLGRASPLISINDSRRSLYIAARGRNILFRTFGELGDPAMTILHNHNTTTDNNGFIKAASPTLKLTDSGIEYNNSFSAPPKFRKLDTGVYEISNTLGLAKEGWTIETPKDRHGRPYFHVIVQESFGRVIIRVHDEYEVRKTKTIRDIYGEEQEVEVVEKILGEARDIKPHERWIDLRFHEEPEEHIDEDEEWMKYFSPRDVKVYKDGITITGKGEPDDNVTVKDEEGSLIGEGKVNSEGAFEVVLNKPIDGAIKVGLKDEFGNTFPEIVIPFADNQ